jgi:hypothetical protein
MRADVGSRNEEICRREIQKINISMFFFIHHALLAIMAG